MRRLLLSACLASLVIASAGSGEAQARPDSLKMSCASVANLVRSSGAVVIGTGPNIYERFVTLRSYCTLSQVTEPAWIQTADQRQCLVGKRCVEKWIRRRGM